jgi:HAD superfamily hydrolase (TIGR01509 family)
LSEKRFWELVQQDLKTNISWEELNNIVKSGYYPISGSIELLQKYSELTNCYLLSNTRREWFEYLDSIYHITKYVKYSFLSYEMKKTKPSVDIFLEAIQQIGVEPRSIIFIDDSLENIQVARTLGIHVHHFNDVHSVDKFIKRLTKE